MTHEYDQPYPRVEVKRSRAGLGLFAGEDIKKDQLIIEYTGDRIDEAEADRRGGKYLFTVTDNLFLDGKDRKHTGRYLNHSCRPNAEAEHETTEDRIYIRAKKRIQAGEEITYHYGQEYFKQLIKPAGCKCSHCQKTKSQLAR